MQNRLPVHCLSPLLACESHEAKGLLCLIPLEQWLAHWNGSKNTCLMNKRRCGRDDLRVELVINSEYRALLCALGLLLLFPAGGKGRAVVRAVAARRDLPLGGVHATTGGSRFLQRKTLYTAPSVYLATAQPAHPPRLRGALWLGRAGTAQPAALRAAAQVSGTSHRPTLLSPPQSSVTSL